jgi:hypothetical protein
MRYWIIFILGVIAFHFLRITRSETAKSFWLLLLAFLFFWAVVILATP